MRILNKRFLLLTASTLITSTLGGSGSKVPVSVNIQDGKFVDIVGLDEPFTYSLKGKTAGMDTELGVSVDVEFKTASLDGVSLPYSFWGTLGRKIGGWNLNARADVDVEDFPLTDLSVSASNEEWDTSMKVLATNENLNNVELRQGFSIFGGGKVMINPSYDMKCSKGECQIGYSSSDSSTGITVKTGSEETKLTVSQKVTNTNRVSPSITSDGKFSLQWQKYLSSSGDSVTTTIAPSDSISLKWNDGPWTANFKTPLSGFKIGEIDVGISRKVPFL